MKENEIIQKLFELQDEKYRNFQSKLIPTINPESIIGVKTPELKTLAKDISKGNEILRNDFLSNVPHRYFEENQLQAFIISDEKDFDKCIDYLENFLPYIDNWATCDQLCPAIFKKNRSKLLPYINKWINSNYTYTIRFAIKLLMQHFLNEDFKPEYLEMVAKVESSEYYINMMRAWYFATSLAKQYESTITVIQEKRLDIWTHNKTIQKAIESFRITPEQKTYLRSLRVK
ncbi:MAG: DNA alkylation repair protein [Treponemataceae bacterium]|nr:DNA alkylation repair protein [Spirochaetales bacterium]MDY6031099.1 DNA alkylation repair protein [Treponemataceae bacterium]